MTNFMINLFVPDSQDGSITAIQAHIAAREKQGSVRVERCTEDTIQEKIEAQLHVITIADGENAKQPDERNIWIVGFKDRFEEKIYDELAWFAQHHKAGYYSICDDWQAFYINLLRSHRDRFSSISAESVIEFAKSMCNRNTRLAMKALRVIFKAEDFEILMAYLLSEEPDKAFDLKNHFALKLLVDRFYE